MTLKIKIRVIFVFGVLNLTPERRESESVAEYVAECVGNFTDVQISVNFFLWILSVGIRSIFSKKSASFGIGQPFFWKLISLISTICGVFSFTGARLADS